MARPPRATASDDEPDPQPTWLDWNDLVGLCRHGGGDCPPPDNLRNALAAIAEATAACRPACCGRCGRCSAARADAVHTDWQSTAKNFGAGKRRVAAKREPSSPRSQRPPRAGRLQQASMRLIANWHQAKGGRSRLQRHPVAPVALGLVAGRVGRRQHLGRRRRPGAGEPELRGLPCGLPPEVATGDPRPAWAWPTQRAVGRGSVCECNSRNRSRQAREEPLKCRRPHPSCRAACAWCAACCRASDGSCG